jgi:hypothetical protein
MREGWENAAGYFEVYQTTRLPISEKSNFYFHRRGNHKSLITYFCLVRWPAIFYIGHVLNAEYTRDPARNSTSVFVQQLATLASVWLHDSASLCQTLAGIQFVLWLQFVYCPSHWPRGLRHELSSLARTLGSWVGIQLKAWMSVFILCLYCCVCR